MTSETETLRSPKPSFKWILWQCKESAETRGRTNDPRRGKPCGKWNVFKSRFEVTDEASSHRPHCQHCGRRVRLRRKDVTHYGIRWDADQIRDSATRRLSDGIHRPSSGKHQCPHCGCHHNTWIYVYKGGSCTRTFGTKKAHGRLTRKPSNRRQHFESRESMESGSSTQQILRGRHKPVQVCAHFGRVEVKADDVQGRVEGREPVLYARVSAKDQRIPRRKLQSLRIGSRQQLTRKGCSASKSTELQANLPNSSRPSITASLDHRRRSSSFVIFSASAGLGDTVERTSLRCMKQTFQSSQRSRIKSPRLARPSRTRIGSLGCS